MPANSHEITYDDVLRVLLEIREDETRREWLERAEITCQEWGPVCLYYAQEEINRLRVELEKATNNAR